MKYLIIILILSSCSASWHLNKAKKKGAEFGTEVVYKYNTKTDTIIDTLTNTVEIRTTIVDSFPYEVKTIKYVPLSRQERLKYRDSMKHERNMYKLLLSAYKDSLKQSKQITRLNNRKFNRSEKNAVKMEKAQHFAWWVWLFIGSGITLVLVFFVKIRGYFKKMFFVSALLLSFGSYSQTTEVVEEPIEVWSNDLYGMDITKLDTVYSLNYYNRKYQHIRDNRTVRFIKAEDMYLFFESVLLAMSNKEKINFTTSDNKVFKVEPKGKSKAIIYHEGTMIIFTKKMVEQIIKTQ